MNPGRALLGAVLSGFADIDSLTEIVQPADFFEPRDGEIWSAARRARETGNKIDPVSVRMAMGEGSSKLPGGPLDLVELAQECAHVGSAAVYARRVADDAAGRRLAGAAVALEELSRSGRTSSALAEHARTIVDRATAQTTTVAGVSLSDVMPGVLDIAEHGRTAALSTGWADLDRIIDGISPGRLIVIGARPGVGKSLMGTNLAVHAAHHHKHAELLASMEMPRDEVGQRILAHHAGVNLSSLMNGTVDPQAWDRIAKNTPDLMSLPITIEDGSGQTVGSIRSSVRNLKRRRDDVALV